MALHPLAFGPLVVLLAMAVVGIDVHRRNRPWPEIAAWSVAAGLLSLFGFVVLVTNGSVLFRQYLALSGQPLVVRTPYEVLLWELTAGSIYTGALCLLVAVGTRLRATRST